MSSEAIQFETLLKSRGYFVTKARRLMFRTLQANEEITIKQLISLLKANDQATVYRNILLFEKLGIIHRLRLGWNSKLELSDLFRPHHHHASCDSCHKTFGLEEDEALEEKIKSLVRAVGFLVQTHSLEIHGLCKDCQNTQLPAST